MRPSHTNNAVSAAMAGFKSVIATPEFQRAAATLGAAIREGTNLAASQRREMSTSLQFGAESIDTHTAPLSEAGLEVNAQRHAILKEKVAEALAQQAAATLAKGGSDLQSASTPNEGRSSSGDLQPTSSPHVEKPGSGMGRG